MKPQMNLHRHFQNRHVSSVDNIKKQFGIRSTLNNFSFGDSARQPIKKYLAMFDERDLEIVEEVEGAFV
jgi:hypothetical protein